MAKVDFITLANIIFKDKDKYKFVTDEEKEASFFMLNRKYAFKYLKQAQFLNDKSTDRASAIDLWYQIFYKTSNGTPAWWWKAKADAKPKSEFTNADFKLVKEFYGLSSSDMNFLVKYSKDKLKLDIKRIKKFKKD
jgi:hypothetical protein